MIEREMEDLLWEHPEKFLNEPLEQFERQASSSIGRSDLIFLDRIGRLMIIEIKHGTLTRNAIPQLIDYYGMLKSRYPEKSIELVVIANYIPKERRIACEQKDIDTLEIHEKKFRDVAAEVGYVFQSESKHIENQQQVNDGTLLEVASKNNPTDFRETLSPISHKIEKGWYYWEDQHKRGYFLAFVNGKGSCSIRRFEANSGIFRGKEYKSGDYQERYSNYLKTAILLRISRQPSLERDCKERLPSFVLEELKSQVKQDI